MVESLTKSMKDPEFRRHALAFGKMRRMPWMVGCEKAYHYELCRKSLDKGEKISFDAAVEHDDLLREAILNDLVDTAIGPDGSPEMGEALRTAWQAFQRDFIEKWQAAGGR